MQKNELQENVFFLEAKSCPNHNGKECINMCLTRCCKNDNLDLETIFTK